ncbi:hypothetical protein HanRHA438_Chr06g0256461 [Helianthus annuus]|nr:hypothetical protein HanRHA438_Chr06g0256461 [Helianthus annuus]
MQQFGKKQLIRIFLGLYNKGVASGVNLTGDFDGVGLISKGCQSNGKFNPSSSWIDKSMLKCDHCDMTKHTKEQCFRLMGYPEWWADGHKKGRDGKGGRRQWQSRDHQP